MKKYFLPLVLVFLGAGIFLATGIRSQGFNSITTPDGVNMIAVGNNGKMYRSANGGSSWVSLTNGTFNLNCVTSLGNDVWIAANVGNVYKTQKTSSSANLYYVGSSENLNSVSFPDPNVGYVCGDNGKVYKSTNGGVNWVSVNSGLPAVKFNSISFKDADNGVLAGDNGKLYTTTNRGVTWLLEASGTTNNLLKAKYFPDGIIVTGENGTLLKSSGASFSTVVTRIKTDIRGVAGTNTNDVHVCGGGGFIRNNKSGSLNFLNFEQNPMMAQMSDIFYFDANNGWAVCNTNSVIIYTTNGGGSWNMPSGSNVTFNWVSKPGASGSFLGNNLSQHPNNRNTVFIVFSNQVYVSRNSGENWNAVGNALPGAGTPHSFYVSPLDTNIWMCAMEAATDIVVRSTNYGSTWTTVLTKNFTNYGQPLEMDQNNPSVYYFAGDSGSANGNGGFFKSTNNGASFTNINTSAPFRSPCDILIQWDNSNTIFVADGVTGSGVGDIFKSTNGGLNWTKVHSNGSSSEIPSMTNTPFDNNLIWCTEWGGSNVYKSTNNGSNFSVSHSTGFSGWGSDLCREDPTALITGSWNNNATVSLNSGSNWTNISSGLSGHGGGILFADKSFVLAQQGSNVYKLNITYTDNPVSNNIDVQALSLGNTGTNYFLTNTITPFGIVKNNNGGASATFTVTRTISPGNYLSTKSVTNLAANASTSVDFDPWTFTTGIVYTVKDSVYIVDDSNPANDVLSSTLTPYLGQAVSKIDEDFSSSFPPQNWSFQYSGTNYWIGSSASAYGQGNGSAEYNFWNANAGTNQSMFTPTFPFPSVAGDSLSYDYAYAPYTDGSTDSLIIETSTNGGTSYTTLIRFYGRNNASGNNALNTAPASGSEFTPNANQWASKKLSLPVGTNKIKFRARSGYGNNLYLDNIQVNTFILYTLYDIKLAPQGYYNGTSLNMKDTITAFLRNNTSPYSKVDSSDAILDSLSYTAPCIFENAQSGTYYIQLIHRNALETWSASGNAIVRGSTANYDFTSSQSQSYGNNSVLVGSLWCIYSGDVNADGAIDLSDIVSIFNDASVFNSGYIVTDVNGDGTADLSDIVLAFNNSSVFVTVITP